MRLNYPRLWTFYNVAQTKNCTVAARRIHLTQPAVSTHLSHLARELGVKLFERKDKQMELTDDGAALFRYAESIFNLSEKALEEIATRKTANAVRIDLAAGLLFVEHYLPTLLGAFQKQYPGVQLRIHTGPTRPLIEKMISYECQFAFLGHVPGDANLVAKRILEDRIVVIVGARHALSRRQSISLQELSDWPIVSFAKGSETRTVFEDVLQREGISLMPIMETFSSEGIKRAVEAGIGIAPFLLRPAERELREKTLVALPIEGRSIMRVHNFVYRRDYPMSPVARHFKTFVLDAIRKGWTSKSSL